MDQNGHQLVAKAHPSKAFFIEMLTRDITLADCILDLVDNSVHSHHHEDRSRRERAPLRWDQSKEDRRLHRHRLHPIEVQREG